MARGEPAFACKIGEPDTAMQVLMKKFRRSSLLPGCQTSLRMPRCFLEHTVPLDEMRSEDEAELIESQYRGTVAPPKKRKDAFGDLGHN